MSPPNDKLQGIWGQTPVSSAQAKLEPDPIYLSRYATTEEILVNVTPQETRVAVMEHGVTHELHIERASARGFVGNI